MEKCKHEIKCLLISDTFLSNAMPITFAVKIVRLKVYMNHCQSDDIDLHSRSQVCLKLDYFLTCNISDNIEAIAFKLGMTVDLDICENGVSKPLSTLVTSR